MAVFRYHDGNQFDPPEPPDPEYEGVRGEIVIEFNKDEFLWIGGSMEFDDPSVTFEDFYDEEYGSFVADGATIENYVYEALMPYFPEYEQEGRYAISGWVSIPYIILKPTRFSIHDKEYYTPEADIDSAPVAGEIEIVPLDE